MRSLYTLLLTAALLLAFACSPDPEHPGRTDAGEERMVIEAEEPVSHAAPATVTEMQGASGERGLELPDKALQGAEPVDPAVFEVTVERSAPFHLWLRARWQDGCGNSLAVAINDKPPLDVGNDGTYGTWHWVQAGRWDLTGGEHRLALHWREDGLAIDQLLLTTNPDFWPEGVLAASATVQSPPAEPARDGPPAPPALQPDAPLPFRAAVGGSYRSGFEGALVRLGIPTDRLHGNELVDPVRLARYDLICLSSPDAPRKEHIAALEAFVRDGGVLVTEFVGPHDHLSPANDPKRLLSPHGHRNRADRLIGGCRIIADESSFFGGHDGEELWLASDVRCGRLDFEPAEGTGIEMFGQVRHGRRLLGAAILRRPFGKGRLYFLAAPLGFHSMWRGDDLDGVLRNVLLDAAGDRCRLVYDDMPHEGGRMPGLLFADDFMGKSRKVGDNWAIEGGQFERWLLYRPNVKDAFSIHGQGPGCLSAVGNPNWSDYRLSASVKPRPGTAGIWVGLSDGTRLRLTLVGSGSGLVMEHVATSGARELGRAGIARYPGWRRLSLFERDDHLLGYVDGVQAIAVPRGNLGTIIAPFGLAVRSGKALFDDVAVREVASLLPHTDRAPGEEGSCRSQSSISGKSIEARNLYTQQWHLPPSPNGDGHLEPALPLYSGGTLLVDGEPLARVDAGTEPARVLMPYSHRPRQTVEVLTNSWQDYVFSARMTDWYSHDDWEPQPRWSCDPEWQWPGVESRRASVLWHKRKLEPPYAVVAYVGAASVRWLPGMGHYGRDLNLVLAGNGRNLEQGLSLRIMDEDRGCELWRGDTRLAQSQGTGLPTGHSLHHIWWEIKAVVDNGRVRVFFDDHKVIDHDLAAPLKAGHLGIWTRRNAISVGRVTIAAEPRTASPQAAAPGASTQASVSASASSQHRD